ncbi:unnamed protein product [Macrosiphum euphorbiae]|uniref:Cyclin-dependent kinase 9 n=1 Tax=Macrosiphum euphorbiae TaxID=13131 RepID=A0AAV0XHM8_9HEMI|nr:unnamed protein product [Macrosiphum euphorbiae]
MMEVFKNSHNSFDLLPDEMVLNTLSLIDADTLLNCRLVCKRWRELIDAYVFQEKASRENEFVNDGQGYDSFSQIDSNSVRKLELPWYVFYVISKYDPFNKNLVTDPRINSMFRLCSKSQRITFKNYGLNDTVMKTLQPEISVSEWYEHGHFVCGCKFVLSTVFDGNGEEIGKHNFNDALLPGNNNIRAKASHSFKNLGNASYLMVYHCGLDTRVLANTYDTNIIMIGSEVKVLLPIKFKNAAEHRLSLLETSQTRVFEFCEHDLAGLLSNTKVKFNIGAFKQVIQQMINGLDYLHSNNISHRDMKAANVLITKTGTLKLADFGLARAFSAQINGQPANWYTNRVVTLWYLPPKLLLGDRNYGPPVELWGSGCIMAEMWTRSPIMQVESLDLYNQLELVKGQKRKVKKRLKPYVRDPMGCDLLDKLLVLDPAKRFDADSALNHDFFWTDPMPCDLSKMISQQTQSNFEYLAPRRLNNHQSSAMRPASTVPSQGTSTSATSGFHELVF